MTANLTPEELGAREFWRQAATGSMPAHYFASEYNRLSGKYSDDESAALEVELDQIVGDLGYGTDMSTISAAMAAGMATDLGHWAGTYGLVDEQDTTYQLDVDEEGATLTLPPSTVDSITTVRSIVDYQSEVTLSGKDFTGGKLTLSNVDHSATLTFEYATTLADLARTDGEPPEFVGRTQPRCRGELRSGEVTHQLRGKRGCYTAAGIRRVEDGDPASTWAGVYHVMDITEAGAWTWLPEPLVLSEQGDGLSARWGDRSGSDVRCGQNHLLADLSNPKAQLALRFEIVDGKEKRFAGVCRADGTDQVLHGYWLHPEPPAKASRLTATTIRPMGALEAADPEKAADPEVTLDAAAADRTIELPIGVPGHPYRLRVRLKNAATLGEKPYTWAIPGFDKLRIVPDGSDSTLATLTGQFAVGDAGNKNITLTVTPATRASATFTGSFQVAILNMVVTPATLPPVVRRMDYRVGFEVNGGIGPYTWVETKDSVLPGGLRFDPAKHELSGQIGGTSASQDVYTLRLEVRSDKNVLMAPLKVSIPFSVNEPVQVGGEAMGYFQFVVGALGSVFMVLSGVRAVYDWRKSARRNAGDPNIHRGYQWADRMGKAISASLEGPIGKRYATNIERAVRYDTENRGRGLTDPVSGKKLPAALDVYEKAINEYNGKVDEISAKLDRARERGSDRRIKELESRFEDAKLRLRDTLEKANHGLTIEERAARDEKRVEKERPFREKIARRMPWR